jgi:hypothetical protein
MLARIAKHTGLAPQDLWGSPESVNPADPALSNQPLEKDVRKPGSATFQVYW